MTVDQDGNLYLAEVFNGRVQKFRPKAGADSAKLVGQELRYKATATNSSPQSARRAHGTKLTKTPKGLRGLRERRKAFVVNCKRRDQTPNCLR